MQTVARNSLPAAPTPYCTPGYPVTPASRAAPGTKGLDPGTARALEQAAGAIARLDQALQHHPLLPALLARTRLEAVRRQAAADGHGIDPWHLAAMLEGLRLRMDGALRIIDRGAIFSAARLALDHHQWLANPDPSQETAVQAALRHLNAADNIFPNAPDDPDDPENEAENEAENGPGRSPGPGAGNTENTENTGSTLLTAAVQVQSWLAAGGARPPIRAALVRFWVQRGLLQHPLPLTGAGALAADAPDRRPDGQPECRPDLLSDQKSDPLSDWPVRFLRALADEARDTHQLLRDLERRWLAARRNDGARRSTSRAAAAIDVLAAAPLLSATTLAQATGLSVKSATVLLDGFVARGIAVEVTGRSARRLFGLAGLAPLRAATRPPQRPQPGRGRGRPRNADAVDAAPAPPPLPPLPPASRFDRPPLDYAALDAAIAACDQAIRATRHRLNPAPAASAEETA